MGTGMLHNPGRTCSTGGRGASDVMDESMAAAGEPFKMGGMGGGADKPGPAPTKRDASPGAERRTPHSNQNGGMGGGADKRGPARTKRDVSNQMTVYTVGHGTRTTAELAELLAEAGVVRVADVRRYPASRRHPHFSRPRLEVDLPAL